MYHRLYYLDIYTLFKFQLPCHLELADQCIVCFSCQTTVVLWVGCAYRHLSQIDNYRDKKKKN